MFWRRRVQLTDPDGPPPRASDPFDFLIDEFLDTWIRWLEACADVRAAYLRWTQSEAEQRDLAFAGYRAALDREDQAARVHSMWTERLRTAKSTLRGHPEDVRAARSLT